MEKFMSNEVHESCINSDCHDHPTSSNLVNNYINIFYNFWSNKFSIKYDKDNPTSINQLEDIWYYLIESVLEHGIIFLLLNYGEGITIAKPMQIYYDKNKKPVAAQVSINDINNNFISNIYCFDYEVMENKEYYETLVNKLGWGTGSELNVYKAIPFQLNTEGRPTLCNLKAVLAKIAKLSKIDDANLEVANVIFKGSSDTRLTNEQASNVSVTLTRDRKGVFLVNQNKNEEIRLNNITSDLVSSISNWPNISSELNFYKKEFYELSGINFQPSNAATRQNTLETANRISISNSVENIFFNWVQKFIVKYEKYYGIDIEIETNSSIDLIKNLSDVNGVFRRDMNKIIAGDEISNNKGE